MNELNEAILIENDKYGPEEELEEITFLYNLNEGESNELIESDH